jgi:hypothetical protein
LGHSQSGAHTDVFASSEELAPAAARPDALRSTTNILLTMIFDRCLPLSSALLLGSFLASTAQAQSQFAVGPTTPYPTIQAAIDAAAAGDTIVVAPGVYTDFVTISKDITLLGPNSDVPALPESGWTRGGEAIIPCSRYNQAQITVTNGATVCIKGFHFTGTPTFRPYALFCEVGTSGEVCNNWFDKISQDKALGQSDIISRGGPWQITGNRFDGKGYGILSSDAAEGSKYAQALFADYGWEGSFHGNRVEGYAEHGIRFASVSTASLTSNLFINNGGAGVYVSANTTQPILIQGNTFDNVSRGYEHLFGSDPLTPDYSVGAVQVDQHIFATALTEIRNNDFLNLRPGVAAVAISKTNSQSQTIGAISQNNLSAIGAVALIHEDAAVRAVGITSGVATLIIWGGDTTYHYVGNTVLVQDLGPTFDGSHVLTDVSQLALPDYLGISKNYRSISYALPGAADVPYTLVEAGTAASEADAIEDVPAEQNWWGDNTGPSSPNSNRAGGAANPEPWIWSYTAGTAPTGFLAGLGFWPENVILSDYDADSDGLGIAAELLVHNTDDTNPDTDGDGLLDGVEVLTYATNPLSVDTDSDTLSDFFEINLGYDPLDRDDPVTGGASTEEAIATVLQDFGLEIVELDLGLFQAKTNPARRGRRVALCNKMFRAAEYVLVGDYTSAIDTVQSALGKVQPATGDKKTWLIDAQTYSTMLTILDLLIQTRGY